MKKILIAITLVGGLQGIGIAHSQALTPGTVERVMSRDASIPVYTVWRDYAVATVVLYSGGAGGYGKIGADGWPDGRNFLIRSAQQFAAYPFNLVLVGRATDVPALDGPARISAVHETDNRAVFRAIKAHSAAPIWLVGTSMGTLSVAAAAIGDTEHEIAGIVMTSTVTATRIPGAVPTQALDQIRTPVLIVHHRKDACKVSPPDGVLHLAEAMSNAPIKQTVMVDGGSGESGGVCEPLHFHGYIGMEKETVDRIAAWIQQPQP